MLTGFADSFESTFVNRTCYAKPTGLILNKDGTPLHSETRLKSGQLFQQKILYHKAGVFAGSVGNA